MMYVEFDSHFLDMMYVELMKNFFLADSRELMGVRVISSSEPKNVWFLLSRRCTSRSWKIFFSLIRANWWVLESFRPPEPKNVCLLHSRHDVRRVHEKFFLADSSELVAVRVISASWVQKRLIPTFWTRCTTSSWKVFFSPVRANWWALESFRNPEPKNVWFPLPRDGVRRIHEKFFLAYSS